MKAPKFNTPMHVVRAELTKEGIDTTWNAKHGTLTAYDKKTGTHDYQFALVHGSWFFKCNLLNK
jgi:hypothetical protein